MQAGTQGRALDRSPGRDCGAGGHQRFRVTLSGLQEESYEGSSRTSSWRRVNLGLTEFVALDRVATFFRTRAVLPERDAPPASLFSPISTNSLRASDG